MQQSLSAVRRLSDLMHAIAPMANDGRAFANVLSALMNIHAEDVMALHKVYLSILELFEQAIAEGNSIENPSQKQLFLVPILEFQKHFQQQTIRSSANSFHIAEPTLSRLKYATEFINLSVEQPVEADVLAKLLQDTGSMIEQIIQSDLPKYLKSRLIEVLEKMRFAIITYRVHGISALRKATEEMTGVLAINKAEIVQTVNKNEKSKKTVFDLITFVTKANAVVELATKLKELAAPVMEWLLPGENQP